MIDYFIFLLWLLVDLACGQVGWVCAKSTTRLCVAVCSLNCTTKQFLAQTTGASFHASTQFGTHWPLASISVIIQPNGIWGSIKAAKLELGMPGKFLTHSYSGGLQLCRICLGAFHGAFHDMRRHVGGKHFASQFHHDAIGISGISDDGGTIIILLYRCSYWHRSNSCGHCRHMVEVATGQLIELVLVLKWAKVDGCKPSFQARQSPKLSICPNYI